MFILLFEFINICISTTHILFLSTSAAGVISIFESPAAQVLINGEKCTNPIYMRVCVCVLNYV